MIWVAVSSGETVMVDTECTIQLQQTGTGVLVQLVRAGDGDAFSELMDRYDGKIRRTAYSILRNTEDTEDAIQETYLRVFSKIHTFEGTAAFSTWLTRIVINTSLMRLRKRRTRPTLSLDELTDGDGSSFLPLTDDTPSPEQQCSDAELKKRLQDAVEKLPHSLKGVFEDHLYAEMCVQQLAEKRGLTIAAAKSRVYRARKMLFTLLNPQQCQMRSVAR